MQIPVIGITPYIKREHNWYYLNRLYTRAIESQKGVPIILAYNEYPAYYINLIDGLLLAGGGDIDPSFYGEVSSGSEKPYRERDEFEIAIIKLALKKSMPILGICRGAQLINVALGGSLYQDLNTNITHDQKTIGLNKDELYHSIKIEKDSIMYEIFKSNSIHVNSFHHQGLKKMGSGLRPTAFAEDGTIEAIESTNEKQFILGVQFHPEHLWMSHSEFSQIFNTFIKRVLLHNNSK